MKLFLCLISIFYLLAVTAFTLFPLKSKTLYITLVKPIKSLFILPLLFGYIIFFTLVSFLFVTKSFGEQQITKAIYTLPLKSPIFKNKSPEQISKYLKECGINAVVHVPLNNSIINQLRKNGIKAYAELSMFSGNYYWDEHPESRPVLSDGNLVEMDGWYAGICPSQQWLIDQKIKEAENIAREYPIDGLWLDFMRWPTRWEVKAPKIQHACFCKSCLKRFQDETGVRIPEALKSTKEISRWIYKNHSENWYGWRSDVIVDTAKKIRGVVTKYRKDAIIGIFLVPWREEDFDNAIYKVIGQDIEKLSKVIDVFSPMSYHLLCYRDTGWIISLTQWMKLKTDKEIWPIVQATDEPKKMSTEEYEKALKAGLAGGSTGVMTLTAEATLEDRKKWEIQKQIFVKTPHLDSISP